MKTWISGAILFAIVTLILMVNIVVDISTGEPALGRVIALFVIGNIFILAGIVFPFPSAKKDNKQEFSTDKTYENDNTNSNPTHFTEN